MRTNQNQIANIFENLNLTFTDIDENEGYNERRISKPQKVNRWANASVRAMKQFGGEAA